MVVHAPTVEDNIRRGLKHLGLEKDVVITRVDEDRVYGWPSTRLEQVCKFNRWYHDPNAAAEREHGVGTRSYRQPGHPSMQICFHPTLKGPPHLGLDLTSAEEEVVALSIPDFVEIDYDYAAPEEDVESALIHLGEVIGHAVTGGKTDQGKVALLLDHRYGPAV